MNAWVVTELQHIEMPSLRAAPDAVDTRDVGALALHCKQGTDHVLVAVMLEVCAPHQDPHQHRHKSTEPGKAPTVPHGPRLWQHQSKQGVTLSMQVTTFSDAYVSPPQTVPTFWWVVPCLIPRVSPSSHMKSLLKSK